MSTVADKLNEMQEMMNKSPKPISEIKALYRFDIKDSGEQFDVHILDSVVNVASAGQFAKEPACVIRLAQADMIKLLNHELNTTIAYMMGQIKVEGKLGPALKLLEALAEYK